MRVNPLLSALLLFAAGCTTVPPRTAVVPAANLTSVPAIAASLSATLSHGLSIERWWAWFADTQLEKLMDEALAHNEDLEAAMARIREAEASLDLARAAAMPTLDLTSRNGRSRQSEAGAIPLPPGVRNTNSSQRVSLEAGFELDLWGRLTAATGVARAQLLATEWTRKTIQWSLSAHLAETYFSLGAVDRQIDISTAVRAGRLSTVRLRQAEYAGGAGNEFDLRRAESELASTDVILAGLARQRAALERALIALLGRTPGDIANGRLHPRTLDESEHFGAVLPQGAVADLLTRRPDIGRAEAQLAAANHSIEAARTAALPAVRLSGNLGSDARAVADLFNGRSMIWSMFASLTQAITDGGRVEARFREEKARAEQALANYRKTVATAMLDVREAYEVLDVASQAYEAERRRAGLLARAHELAQQGKEHGALSALDLLDAERNWRQAQLQQVGAHRDRLVAQVSAFKALGGGYTSARSTISTGAMQ